VAGDVGQGSGRGAVSGGGVLQGDAVAEGLEPGDEVAGFPFGVLARVPAKSFGSGGSVIVCRV
jgi:hypothetical protein